MYSCGVFWPVSAGGGSWSGCNRRRLAGHTHGEANTSSRAAASLLGRSEQTVVVSLGTDRPSERHLRVEELFKAHAAVVLAYVMRRGTQHIDAEDIVAETFLVCFRRISEVPEDALPWLLGVARKMLSHRVRAERRRRCLTAKLLEEIVDPTGHVSRSTTDARMPVFTALRRLPLRERKVARLVILEDLSPEGAAKALGLTRKAVYCHLARARAKLRSPAL